ncbi:MAG: thioredoxin domain-containing protein [bacterium]
MHYRKLLIASSLILALGACGKKSDDTAVAAPQDNATEVVTPVETDAPNAGGDSQNSDSQTSAPQDHATATTGIGTQEMFQGDADAPAVIIEYASTTCPHCASFHKTIIPKIKERYIDTGRAKFVFREFPTPPAQLAYITFAVARCSADANGKEAYFSFLDTYFNNQDSWLYGGGNPLQEIAKLSAQGGFGEEQIKTCVQREEIIKAINKNISTGIEEYDITGTPSFVVNGKKLEKYTSEEEFLEMLEEAVGPVAASE